MAKKNADSSETREDAVERMNKALKKMMETPPETHEEMVRRRAKAKPSARKK